jgi:hypothetical protein
MPLRLAGRASLGQERYDRLDPDAVRLGLRTSTWREHEPQPGATVIQPVLNVPIEWLMNRWKLPPPALVRASVDGDVEGTLAAIAATIAAVPTLKAIVLEGSSVRLDTASSRLAALGFSQAHGDRAGMMAFELRTETSALPVSSQVLQ